MIGIHKSGTKFYEGKSINVNAGRLVTQDLIESFKKIATAMKAELFNKSTDEKEL